MLTKAICIDFLKSCIVNVPDLFVLYNCPITADCTTVTLILIVQFYPSMHVQFPDCTIVIFQLIVTSLYHCSISVGCTNVIYHLTTIVTLRLIVQLLHFIGLYNCYTSSDCTIITLHLIVQLLYFILLYNCYTSPDWTIVTINLIVQLLYFIWLELLHFIWLNNYYTSSGCTIVTLQLIVEEVRKSLTSKKLDRAVKANAVLVDHFLWDYRRDHAAETDHIPIHNIRCIYYWRSCFNIILVLMILKTYSSHVWRLALVLYYWCYKLQNEASWNQSLHCMKMTDYYGLI